MSECSHQLLRGIQLNAMGRHADAEVAIRAALAQQPSDDIAMHHLALAQYHQPGKGEQALETIGEALRLQPNDPDHHVLKSFILSSVDRPKPALASAREALSLDATIGAAFCAEAQAHVGMQQWALAEHSARQALELDADNSMAANLLAHALRLQKKDGENARHLQGMLARDPEDAFTHANSGWAALQRGDHRQAEEHFREALRLNPEMHFAREGLMNSFRARSRFYRAYLQYCFAMQRLTGGSRWMVTLGLYLAYRFSMTLAKTPFKPLAYAFCALYLIFVLWVWVATAIGNLFLLGDRFARYALRRSEKFEAVLVGGGVLLGVPLLLTGLLCNLNWAFVLGCGLTASAFPLSATLTNGSKAGRWLFGSIGFGMLTLTPVLTADALWDILPGNSGANVFRVGLLLCVLVTWIGNISALRKPMH